MEHAAGIESRIPAYSQPSINVADAITITGIIHHVVGADAFELILKRFSEAAGRQRDVDEAVYRSESETGRRNRCSLATGG